jgi:ribonuclease Z
MLHQSLSLLLKCSQTGIVWLFNCPEGSQHILIEKKIKIHQITHIILTNLDIKNLAGLMGLLSSLSLSSRVHKIHIYGPSGIFQYLQFSRKYSQTTFKYCLEIHIIQNEYVSFNSSHLIYSHTIKDRASEIEYIILEKEKIGRFKSTKAQLFKITPGGLYGDLKLQNRFLVPDGFIISGKYFTNDYSIGLKILYLVNQYCSRSSVELTLASTQIIYPKLPPNN